MPFGPPKRRRHGLKAKRVLPDSRLICPDAIGPPAYKVLLVIYGIRASMFFAALNVALCI